MVTIFPREREAVELRDLLDEGLRRAKQIRGEILVSLTQRLYLPLDIIERFDANAVFTSDRFLWSYPGEAFAFAGFGIAYAVNAVEEPRFRQVGASWRRILSRAVVEGLCGLPGTGPLLVGGFAFDPKRKGDSTWEDFPQARMILPKLSIAQVEGESWITLNVMVNAQSDPEKEAEALNLLRDQFLNLKDNYWGHSRARGIHVTVSEATPPESWKAQVAPTAPHIPPGKL